MIDIPMFHKTTEKSLRVLLFIITMSLLTSCFEAADNSSPKSSKKPGQRGGENNGPCTDISNCTQTTAEISKLFRSQQYRIKGEKQLSNYDVNANIIAGKEDSYREIPNQEYDHDFNVTRVAEIAKDCGNADTLKGLKNRIADCSAKNSPNNFWSGTKNGISGEGDWQLAYKSGNKIVWQDLSTGLLWSSQINKANWREASGVVEGNFLCSEIKFFGEGEVLWRLPTRNEFLLADINGSRFVLNELNFDYWSASSEDKNNVAWAINQENGVLTAHSKDKELFVRCVAHPLK